MTGHPRDLEEEVLARRTGAFAGIESVGWRALVHAQHEIARAVAVVIDARLPVRPERAVLPAVGQPVLVSVGGDGAAARGTCGRHRYHGRAARGTARAERQLEGEEIGRASCRERV